MKRVTKPTKLIIFQKTGFPLFIYDFKEEEVVDTNDPAYFLITSELTLKLSDEDIKEGKIYSMRKKEGFHTFSPLGDGVFIDLTFPLSRADDASDKLGKRMNILRKKISSIHEKTGLSNEELALISASLYEEKIAPKLSSFLKKIGK